MSTKYASHLTNRRQTPQSEAIPGETQVQNNAGGYVYAVDQWQRLTRFLILGSAGGTYYVAERKLTRDNAAVVEACLSADAARTVAEIVAVSDGGRAPKNDQAVFALALAASSPNVDTRKLAYGALRKVCRIPTHLFQFLDACKAMRGWSRGLRNAVSAWYDSWDANGLAYEVVKYQQREGWSNKDVLRLSHLSLSNEKQATLRWVIGAELGGRVVENKKKSVVRTYGPTTELPAIIQAFEEAKTADTARLCALIREFGLTREMVPTTALNHVDVWVALLEKMPLHATIRTLGKMTAVGLLGALNDSTKLVAERLTDEAYLRKSRVHPMAILTAMKVYEQCHGDKGSLTWTPVRQIVDALDAAFYAAFGNVTPTGKNLYLALDVSGSMSSRIADSAISCREACAAMALITMNVEKNYVVKGFTSGSSHRSYTRGNDAIKELAISPRQRLGDVVSYMNDLDFGGTDCALPMLDAIKHKLDVDAFLVFTDSETWAGSIHPSQALKMYRNNFNKDAGEVVVGMTATEFTIADPNDPRTLDVVGFDTATPQAISTWLTS